MPRRSRSRGLTALVAAGTLTVATACGAADAASGPVAAVPEPVTAPTQRDISPRRFAEMETPRKKTSTPTPTPTPTPTQVLTALDVPEEPFPTPPFPDGPKKEAPEIDHIEYKLKTLVWNAAGVVDPKTTKVDCSESEDDLAEVGDYEFTCDVRLWGSKSTFDVWAKVEAKKVEWGWSAARLPVSEEKAVYEATRQSFKPARVTCDIIGMETVEVDNDHGFTCWVTDIYNQPTPYRGELLQDGSLAFHAPDDQELPSVGQ